MKYSAVLAALAAGALAAPFNDRPIIRTKPSNAKLSTQKFGGSGPVWDNLRKNVKYVVYLMLENRSLDTLAGYWDIHPDMDNLRNVTFCNPYTNPNWTVWDEPINICAGPFEGEVPLKDPDHNFAGTSYEIYQKWQPTADDKPNMQGFIERQSDKYSASPGDASFVIKSFNQQETGTFAYLAENYAFWDSYHAEHPGPTNPNRQFATSGSTCGMVDNGDQASGWFSNVTGTSCAKSIFEALSEKNITWKNYYETDIIDSFMYEYVQQHDMDRIVHSDQFYADLENGTLPTFSYYNPECCTIDSLHPLSNAAAGQSLVKHLYDSVRKSKYWNETLIIINFDEHGGFADHVAPPANVPIPEDEIGFNGKSDGQSVTYDFSRLGVRVPAFLISPFVPANTLIHDQGTDYAKSGEPPSAYTHTSFLHFLANLWELEGLNNRVAWSKTFEDVFQSTARSDTPEALPTPIWVGGPGKPEPEAFYKLNQPYSYYASLDT